MVIFALLFLAGFVLTLACVWLLVYGVYKRRGKLCLLAVVVPAVYWWGTSALYYADQRFVRDQREKGVDIKDW